jgi:hypothetical protein
MANTNTVIWQRSDGLVGYTLDMPTGFGDCGFRQLAVVNSEQEAKDFILAIPGIQPNKCGFWKLVKKPTQGVTL